MDAEQARRFLLGLAHVSETRQWGDNLVFWVGDKNQGGKMFCLLDLGANDGLGKHSVAAFAATPERFAELIEQEGMKPAPYLARAFWVAAEQWNALRHSEWKQAFTEAHARVRSRLPRRVLEALTGS